MDENNNCILSTLEDVLNKFKTENAQICKEFEQNGNDDVEYEPADESSTFTYNLNLINNFNDDVVLNAVRKIHLDSTRSPYFSTIGKPLSSQCSVTKQLFAWPQIVQFESNTHSEKHNSLNGFGSISLDIVPLKIPKSAPITSSVFRKTAIQTLLNYKKENKMYCAICEENMKKHPKRIYRSHNIKDAEGNVQCPVLRNYICPKCGATGANAHTEKYCPLILNPQEVIQDSAENTLEKNCPICKDCVLNHPERIIRSHNVVDSTGNVQCLTLWNYKCPKCGATGNNAHTKKYCPQNI